MLVGDVTRSPYVDTDFSCVSQVAVSLADCVVIPRAPAVCRDT
jgi:hypothetical protein